MKKFLKITAVILLSLLIFFVGTFKYRQYKASQILIPKNTTTLIKISVDEMYKSLALNMITHPGFYLKPDLKKDSLSKTNKFDHGLKIPSSIYLYTIQDQPTTALFSRLIIDDFNKFELFIKNTLKLQLSKKDGLNHGKSKLGNLAVLYNADNAAIVFSNEAGKYVATLTEILNQKNQIQLEKSKFKYISQSTDHIAFYNIKNNASINFEKGLLKFENDFVSETIVPQKKTTHRKFDNQSVMNMWFNADFVSTSNKTHRLKNISLDSDSLTKYYNGYMDFEWTGTTHQLDSIITYEYNDDFEKVEKITLQKREIPNLVMSIDATAGLQNYLSRQNVINLDSGTINKSVFPLYKLFVSEADKKLILSTKKAADLNSNFISSNIFFGLNINFKPLNKQASFPFFKPYFKSFKHLNVVGKATSNNKIRIEGTLTFVNENINTLYQILKVM